MAKRKSDSTRWMRFILIGIAFFIGLVVLALTYRAAVNTSTELRSKAAPLENFIASWNFNQDNNQLGWKASDSLSLSVIDGFLNVRKLNKPKEISPYIVRDNIGVGVTGPVNGVTIRKLKMLIGVESRKKFENELSNVQGVQDGLEELAQKVDPRRPAPPRKPTPTPTSMRKPLPPPTRPYRVEVRYSLLGGTEQVLGAVSGQRDGSIQEKVLTFKEVGSVFKLSSLRLIFSDLLPADLVRVDQVGVTMEVLPTATPTPQLTPTPTPGTLGGVKRVFITSTVYNGNLGGVSGADAKCQDRAANQNLGGTWKAWISDTVTSAMDRLQHSDRPYVRLDGVVVADNWADLTDGSLHAAINFTEMGQFYPIPGNLGIGKTAPASQIGVWTNTQSNGQKKSAVNTATCADWTWGFGNGYSSSSGDRGIATYMWSDAYRYGCFNSLPIYCIEQ